MLLINFIKINGDIMKRNIIVRDQLFATSEIQSAILSTYQNENLTDFLLELIDKSDSKLFVLTDLIYELNCLKDYYYENNDENYNF